MKRKLKKKNLIIFTIIFILIIIVLVLSMNKIKLIGRWKIDRVTYEFKLNNKGYLKTPISKYEFKYKVKGKTLYIDFKKDNVNDFESKISFKNKKLKLISDNGTFIFNKE